MAHRAVTHLIALSTVSLMLAGSAFAADRGEVEIIYPSPMGTAFGRAEQVVIAVPPAPVAQPAPVTVNVSVNVTVKATFRSLRQERIARDLFQNYVGFVNEYSGPRYPF